MSSTSWPGNFIYWIHTIPFLGLGQKLWYLGEQLRDSSRTPLSCGQGTQLPLGLPESHSFISGSVLEQSSCLRAVGWNRIARKVWWRFRAWKIAWQILSAGILCLHRVLWNFRSTVFAVPRAVCDNLYIYCRLILWDQHKFWRFHSASISAYHSVHVLDSNSWQSFHVARVWVLTRL